MRASVDGQVMQLKVHLGEFAPAGVSSQPLILLGGVEPMHVRVNVDENDAWRVRANADGDRISSWQQSNQNAAALRLLRAIRGAQSLVTGDSTERVDTRVLQIIYSFERGNLPIYVGQQMDVYIDASPEERSRELPSAGAPSLSSSR